MSIFTIKWVIITIKSILSDIIITDEISKEISSDNKSQ